MWLINLACVCTCFHLWKAGDLRLVSNWFFHDLCALRAPGLHSPHLSLNITPADWPQDAQVQSQVAPPTTGKLM